MSHTHTHTWIHKQHTDDIYNKPKKQGGGGYGFLRYSLWVGAWLLHQASCKYSFPW